MVNSNITKLSEHNKQGKGIIETEKASIQDEKSKKGYEDHIKYLESSLASLRDTMTRWIKDLDNANGALQKANALNEELTSTHKAEVDILKTENEKKMTAVET